MKPLNEHDDRRSSPRRSRETFPNLVGVTVESEEAKIVNLSDGGILLECGVRLNPGTEHLLEIHKLNEVLRVRGRVLRCEVARISGGKLHYRIALAFSTPTGLIDGDVESVSLSGLKALVEDGAIALLIDEAGGLDAAFALNSW